MVSVHESVELSEASYTGLAVSSDLDGTDGHLESLYGGDDGDLQLDSESTHCSSISYGS